MCDAIVFGKTHPTAILRAVVLCVLNDDLLHDAVFSDVVPKHRLTMVAESDRSTLRPRKTAHHDDGNNNSCHRYRIHHPIDHLPLRHHLVRSYTMDRRVYICVPLVPPQRSGHAGLCYL